MAEEIKSPYAEVRADGASEDFDKFWANRDRRGPSLKNVLGVDIVLPPSMPITFELEQKKLANTKLDDDKAVEKMVEMLFGTGPYEHWKQQQMDVEQFGSLLLWASANCSGNRISLEEAVELYHNALAKQKEEMFRELRGEKKSGALKNRKSITSGR